MKINGDFQVFENATQTITDLGACCQNTDFLSIFGVYRFFCPLPEQLE